MNLYDFENSLPHFLPIFSLSPLLGYFGENMNRSERTENRILSLLSVRYDLVRLVPNAQTYA